MSTSTLNVRLISELSGHKDAIYDLAGLANDNILSCSADGMVVEWDWRNSSDGKVVAKLDNSSYKIDSSGNMLFIAENFFGIHIIDYASKKVQKSLKFTENAIFDLLFDGDYLFVACAKGIVYRYNFQTGQIIERQLFSDNVRCIVKTGSNLLFSGKGGMFLTTDLEMNIVSSLQGHETGTFAIKRFGDKFYSVGRDAKMNVWNSNWEKEDSIAAHMYTINDVAVDRTGKLLATCSLDKAIRIWDRETGRLLKVLSPEKKNGHTNSVNSLIWTEKSNYLVSCGDDRKIMIWDVRLV